MTMYEYILLMSILVCVIHIYYKLHVIERDACDADSNLYEAIGKYFGRVDKRVGKLTKRLDKAKIPKLRGPGRPRKIK